MKLLEVKVLQNKERLLLIFLKNIDKSHCTEDSKEKVDYYSLTHILLY
jgi:hypothetical protein